MALHFEMSVTLPGMRAVEVLRPDFTVRTASVSTGLEPAREFVLFYFQLTENLIGSSGRRSVEDRQLILCLGASAYL